jgi:DNA primase catalytic core
MASTGDPGDGQPDLVSEARFWREWNTSVYQRAHSPGEAAAIAASVSPDPERIAAMLARAQAGAALTRPPPAQRHGELARIHADVGRFYQSRLTTSWVPGYLARRRLEAVLRPGSPWKIGYAPRSWTALTSHLRSLGHSEEAMLSSGLAVPGRDGQPRDLFHDRLMIPVRRPGDRVVIAFAGRRHPDAGDEHGPKYLNSPNTEIYVKGHVLAGLAEGQRYLDAGAQPVLVEGFTDAWAVSIAAPGRFTGLPLCGTALRGEQVAALARAVDLPERGVRVALDPDSAGRKAAIRAYASLSAATSNLTAVILPEGRDPAQRLQDGGPVALREALTSSTTPLAEIVIDARMSRWARDGELVHAEQQLGALRAAAQAIATMPPQVAGVQASRICRLFATAYGWPQEQVNRELIAAVENHFCGPGQPVAQASARLPLATASVVAGAAAPYQSTLRHASSARSGQGGHRPVDHDRQRDVHGRGLLGYSVSLFLDGGGAGDGVAGGVHGSGVRQGQGAGVAGDRERSHDVVVVKLDAAGPAGDADRAGEGVPGARDAAVVVAEHDQAAGAGHGDGSVHRRVAEAQAGRGG